MNQQLAPLSDSVKQELREAFSIFDKNKDSKIDINELTKTLDLLKLNAGFTDGPEKLKRQIADGISMATEKNPSGPQQTISFEDFCYSYSYGLSTSKNDDELAEALYGLFDYDNNKYISTRNLQKVMESFGFKLTDREVLSMIDAIDADKDQVCNKNDFKKFLGTRVEAINIGGGRK